MEMIGKSDPYVVLYVRPMFKVKTKVINNNLNPVWDETFELLAEDKETQSVILEVQSTFSSKSFLKHRFYFSSLILLFLFFFYAQKVFFIYFTVFR